jgi:hypothetical protein
MMGQLAWNVDHNSRKRPHFDTALGRASKPFGPPADFVGDLHGDVAEDEARECVGGVVVFMMGGSTWPGGGDESGDVAPSSCLRAFLSSVALSSL